MNKETIKLIEQQIKLLSDKSKENPYIEELIELSKAIAQLSNVLKDLSYDNHIGGL